ncbi:interactor of constitutive active ROPs 2, chloroplastic-like [Actinidia eriantha]|uniref:interactor of constitutive active ROPs 2, chloroplastic-like n=1 Tax=Actinidia eriantha TaxID=165200 RepID=UPI0025903FE1|nr:interactor of constitutive active ROPs 2, chloroplastic-like [Actinidia eriantha]
MQTPKTRTGSLEVPQRTSPVTPRTTQKLKVPGSDSDSVSARNPAIRTPKDRSPKVVERKSPRSPMSEKKRPSKVSELESQLAQLQEELKKAKDQLGSSESGKKRAQQEAEETKKELAATSAKLEDIQQQLMELSASEEDRVQELRKLSQERDRAWESELEVLQKQHSMDSAALASTMNEIQKLKFQLERVSESAYAEIQNMRIDLTETLSVVEKLKTQLSDSKESEARALEVVSEIQMQLEMAKTSEEMLRSEGLKAMEACESLALELEQSKARVNSLEEHVNKLQADMGNNSIKITSADPSCNIEGGQRNEEHEDSGQLKAELDQVTFEVGQLRSALDAAEKRYQEEYIQSTLQIRSAYELAERTKLESSAREAELESKLKEAKAAIEDLKANLMAKETKLQSISKENEGLSQKIEKNQFSEREFELEMELKKFEVDLADLKASFLGKENELQHILEENEMLKAEIEKREMEMESNKANNEALTLAEATRAGEREALKKLGYSTEEADESSRRAAHVTEQLDAAQAANSEMEAELKRLKVQSDQWRKAAEAAAAMLSTGNNGKFLERTGSLDYHTIGGKLGLPFSEDMDDESPKKKNSNVLKKIGVLLKKGQK